MNRRCRHDAARLVPIGLALAPLALLGCGAKKASPETNQSVGSATTTAPALSSGQARWRPVPLPLLREGFSASYAFPSSSARLHIDPSGTRWHLPAPPAASGSVPPPPAPPPTAATICDLDPVAQRLTMPDGEILVVLRDGRLMKLATPLAPLVAAIAARLPAGFDPATLRRFQGATTVRAEKGLFWSADGKVFAQVPSLAGYAPGAAILDPAGVGIGLFFPERVAFTRDAGKTWTPVPLPDAHITTVDHQGDRLLALPGGIRDPFPRAIDPATGAVERAPFLPTNGLPLAADEVDLSSMMRLRGSARRRRFEQPRSSPAERPPPRYVPGEEPRGFHLGPAVDGDTVLAFEEVHDERGRRSLRAASGVLGEALVPFGNDVLSSCNVRASALCGARAAVVCDQEIIHFRTGSEIARTSVAADTVVAYDGEGRLWTASPDREKGGGTVLLRRFPLDGALPSPGDEQARVLGGSTPRFLGGCRAPALWAFGETAASKLQGTGFGETLPLGAGALPVAVGREGTLVASTGGELVFLPGDRRVVVKPHLHHHITFAEDGLHALLSTPSGQLEQSDDGGATFQPVATPPVLGRQAIVCGRTRCQLGPSALREGFERDRAAPAITPWPELPGDDGARALHRYIRPEERAKVAATDHFVCLPDAALFAATPATIFAPRTGSWLFVSLGTDEPVTARAFFGAPHGTSQSVPLPNLPGHPPANDRPIVFGGGVGRVWLPAGADTFDRRAGEAAVQWEPDRKARALVGEYPDLVARGDLWTSAGSAEVHTDAQAGELWWASADLDLRRQLAVSRLPTFERQGGRLGVVHAGADDAWYGVFPAPPSSAPDHVPTFTLIAVHADRPNDERVLAVGKASRVEVAAGLLPDADRAALTLLERVEGTETIELRARPLGADLSLGEARVISGTRGPADRLLQLPSCGANAPGALVRLDATSPRAVRIDGRKVVGYLVRLLRVSGEAACVERSILVADRSTFAPLLVVAGNEGIGFAHAGGVRCELVPSPP